MTYDLLGIGTLLVPKMLAKAAGRDGILSIGIGMAAALMYLWILRRISAARTGILSGIYEAAAGKNRGEESYRPGYLIYLVLLAGYVAYLFADIILGIFCAENRFIWSFRLSCCWCCMDLQGNRGRARAYEMLFWFLLIPLFLMLFAAADEVCTDYWAPLGMSSLKGVAGGAFRGVFESFLCIFASIFGNVCQAAGKHCLRRERGQSLLWDVFHAVLYLVLEGIFGVPALAGMDYPAVTLMSTVKISGGFLKKNGCVYVRRVVFTLYALFKQLRLLRKQHSRGIM